MMLSVLVLIPLLTLGLLFIGRGARAIALAGFSLELLATVAVAIMYLRGVPLDFDAVWYAPLNIHYALHVDGISVLMLLLSAVVGLCGVFASWQMERDFFAWYALLAVGVFGFFVSEDLFTMFMFYEVALIPMFLLIGVWGNGRKEAAAMKLTLMLMGGSALLLTGILGIYFLGGETFNLRSVVLPEGAQMWIFPLMFTGFGILGAMFPFHTWSPDGHAAAPTSVSMLHAGVLMKLGGYGCLRVAMALMPAAAAELGWIFLILTGVGVVWGAYGAVVQTDLKYINAYSSVSHCGLVLFAILMFDRATDTGAVMQMLSHGLMTALFFSLIGVIYSRTHTRDIREMGGLMRVMPFAGVCYVIAGLASLGLPGLSGFAAEMTIFFGAFPIHPVWTIVAASSIVVTAVYILRTVGKILYGPAPEVDFKDAVWWERVPAVVLIVCIVAIGVYPLWVQKIIVWSF